MEKVDINKIVDDAMAKKDRMVHIFIMGATVSVDVQPLEKYDPRWIVDNKRDRIHDWNFECSECHGRSREGTSYCPHCGEKLRMPIEEDFKKEESTDESIGKIEE